MPEHEELTAEEILPEGKHRCPECGCIFDDSANTVSAKERWEYTGTILALIVVTSLPVTVLLSTIGVSMLSNVSQSWVILYSIVTLMAATWTFGEQTLKAVREFRNGPDSNSK